LLTTAGGSLRSLSIDGGVTGLGADFIIVDDAVQIKHAAHLERLESVNTLYDEQIASRLNNPTAGGILIIAHRLNALDLTGHVLKLGGWRRIALPLIAKRKKKYRLRNGKTWTRKAGDFLRPHAFDRKELKRIRENPHFEALYQQNPGGDTNLRIKREHIGSFTDTLNSPVTVISVDPGQKGGATNSFSVVQAWTRQDGFDFLLDQWRERCTFTELRSNLLRFVRRYRPSVVLIEGTALGPALGSQLPVQRGMLVELVTPTDNKIERLRRHRKLIRSGRICIPKHSVWREEFLEEVTRFPDLGVDDQVDAPYTIPGFCGHQSRDRAAAGTRPVFRSVLFGRNADQCSPIATPSKRDAGNCAGTSPSTVDQIAEKKREGS
jgi:predicted phage terminase large subunit-like protein